MKVGVKGRMNCDFSEVYDQEEDTYYVTFNTGEPSYCVEVNDVILLEVGLFSKLPTGFRILNFATSKLKAIKIELLKRKIKDSLSKTDQPTFQERNAVISRALDKVLHV
jgi:hypothetical protein